jgi:hypothetical protein
MHYHLEIVLPPVDDIEKAIAEILEPFNKNSEDEDGYRNPHAFWDWYVIGGRWSGNKLMATLGKEAIDKFYEALHGNKITVSSLTMGKQTLQPSNQSEIVNKLWNEFFPDFPVKVCPIFDNYKDRYGDIQKFNNVSQTLECLSVIFAALDYKGEKLKAEFLVQDSFWNGVNHVETKWDGTFGGALSMYLDRIANYGAEYQAKVTPTDDWIVVTIDYHR